MIVNSPYTAVNGAKIAFWKWRSTLHRFISAVYFQNVYIAIINIRTMKLRGYVMLFVFTVCCSTLVTAQIQLQGREHIARFKKYTVQEGDTPAGIASANDLNLTDFLLLNNFPQNVDLTPGTTVLLRPLRDDEIPAKEVKGTGTTKTKSSVAATPTKSSTPAEPKETGSTTAANTVTTPGGKTEIGPGGVKYTVSDDGYHVVQKGQTFYRIALIYGLTADELKALNNMSNTNISPGLKLKVKK
jgi:LysM repeat protein